MKKRDPAMDAEAGLQDFVYRLRRMGYPGNVRVEFPIYTVEDVRWTAKIIHDAANLLVEVTKDKAMNPLQRVLAARGIAVEIDRQLKVRTTHRSVSGKMKHI
jgi:hypothetical protein